MHSFLGEPRVRIRICIYIFSDTFKWVGWSKMKWFTPVEKSEIRSPKSSRFEGVNNFKMCELPVMMRGVPVKLRVSFSIYVAASLGGANLAFVATPWPRNAQLAEES